MNIRRSDKFKDDYKALSFDTQLLVDKKLRLLIESFGKGKVQPSLRIKKIQGTNNPVIWEMSITMGIRATFSIESSMIVLRRLGEHNKMLKKP